MPLLVENESIEDIENSLFTLLESQRKVEELLSLEKDNDELQRVKLDVEIAIEDLKNRLHSRRRTYTSSWTVGQICEVLWHNDIWYPGFIIKRIELTDSWRIGLLGHGIEREVDLSKIRKKENYDWQRGMKCLVLDGFNTSADVIQNYMSTVKNGLSKGYGRYVPAVIDKVLGSEQEAWVMLLDSRLGIVEGESRKVPYDFLERAGKAIPQDDKGLLEGGEDRQKIREKGAKKKRERYIKKQEVVKRKIDDSFRCWKNHFCKGQ